MLRGDGFWHNEDVKRMKWQRTCAAGLLQLLVLVGAMGLEATAQPVYPAAPGTRTFLYLSNKRIITLELLGQSRAILNYINLAEVIEILEAPALLILDGSGKSYRGHVFKSEEMLDSGSYFFVSDLIRPRQFRGYDVLGDFRFQAPPEKAFLRLGGRIVELEPLGAEDFELAALKIAELDLAVEPKLAIIDAGFWRGYGQIHSLGSPEAERVARLVPQSDLLSPVLLKNPRPKLPSRFSELPEPVVVRVRLTVNSQGGVVDPEVVSAPGPELAEQALETVRNSWQFLPALAAGKPADAELVVQVVFDR